MTSVNYIKFINNISKARVPQAIRELLPFASNPDVIFLAGGLPNPNTFPFTEADFKLRDGSVLKIDEKQMKIALQYGVTPGYPELIKEFRKLLERYHKIPSGFETLVTTGSQEGICKAIEMILSPNDYVVISKPAYAGALATMRPYTPRFLEADADNKGIIPLKLKEVLAEHAEMHSKDAPKILHLVPTAGNPTGVSISRERRQQVYDIAKEYDLLILEDDPYYFLEFEKNSPESFLSLDTDGRVIRFDSFSKAISPGLRIGFLTAHRTLVDRIQLHMQVSNEHTSALSQVLVTQLLKKWGAEGFDSHIKQIKDFYQKQRDYIIKAAETHLKGLCEWQVPSGGMFLWIKVLGVKDTRKMIMEHAQKAGVVLVPGCHFTADVNAPNQCLRASFSLADSESFDIAFKKLADIIRTEMQNGKI